MRRTLVSSVLLVFLCHGFMPARMNAQSAVDVNEPAEADVDDVTEVELKLSEQVWFTDVIATAYVQFPEMVEEPADLPQDEDVALIDVVVTTKKLSTGKSNESGAEARIRFLPRRKGLAVFPSLEFQSETRTYRSPATQFMVSAPKRSSQMQFQMQPTTTKVYIGQPLRVDVSWSSQLSANRMRSLQCFPDVFNQDNLEIVIPRCTAPESQQMGLPFGGRRIIADRVPPADDKSQFGTLSFPLFIRFDQPGQFEITKTRLQCALLTGSGSEIAPYAAYYNNGLFEPLSALTAYQRIFAESEPASIEVLPLPTVDQSELYSGLFAPCTIDVSTSTDALTVGQVLNVDIRVRSEAPHGMLDLPPLSLQQSLRGRFHVSEEYGRKWYPDGTGFRARVRPLTTKITAFPSIRVPIFDPSNNAYYNLQTQSVPVVVHPDNGRDYFDVTTLVSNRTLTDQPDGVWQNAQPGMMQQFFNSVTSVLAEHFLLWILGSLLAFAAMLPWVLERRRFATNPHYRLMVEAYRQFKRLPEGKLEKWSAFQGFIAAGFASPKDAWTFGDTQRRLHSIDVSEEDIETLLKTHKRVDQYDFSSQYSVQKDKLQKQELNLPELTPIAGRVFKQFKNMMLRCILIATIAYPAVISPTVADASQWDEAESLFQLAINASAGLDAGLPETQSLYVQSALKFESAAEERDRRGAAWYNAGNAWFEAGELGRAIACYRQSQIDRPFDAQLRENLKAARAMTFDVSEHRDGLTFKSIPLRWIFASFVIVWFAGLAALLFHVRYRKVLTLALTVSAGVIAFLIGSLGVYAWSHSNSEGIIIVAEVIGRKGPGYSYQPAFNEAFHDGLEFQVNESRTQQQSQWLQIELSDGRRCWVPEDQVQLIRNR